MQGQWHKPSLDPWHRPEQTCCPDTVDNTRKWPQHSLLPFCSPSRIKEVQFFGFLKQQEDPSPRIPSPGQQPTLAPTAGPLPHCGKLGSASHWSSEARQGSRSSGWYLNALNIRPHFLFLKSLYLLLPHFPNSAANEAGILQTIALVPYHLN